jgi:hypothetical protein
LEISDKEIVVVHEDVADFDDGFLVTRCLLQKLPEFDIHADVLADEVDVKLLIGSLAEL